jgi:hypothetical protein
MESVLEYDKIFREYINLLRNIGYRMPVQFTKVLGIDEYGVKVFVVQERVNPGWIGNQWLKIVNDEPLREMLLKIILKMRDLFSMNLEDKEIKVALDGQISNWYFPSPDCELNEVGYIDTSTPLFRKNGEEQIDPEIFLKNTPFFLRGIIRSFFLQGVLDRYYDFRSVLVDLVANFYKEGRPDMVYPSIDFINLMILNELVDFQMEQITKEEVDKYYKEDAFIWKFFQAARKFDKWITERILRKRYHFHLPGKIIR